MKLARTTISLPSDLLARGRARQLRLKYGNFSEYLAYLIEDDLKRLPPHILTREDPHAIKLLPAAENLQAAEDPTPYKGRSSAPKKS